MSDHTLGIEASIAAIALGAVAIEKHFRLKKNDEGPDAMFSSDPSEIRRLVEGTYNVWKGMGLGNYQRAMEEKKKYVI